MRRVIKFFDVVIIGLLLTVFALTSIISKFTLDKSYIQKTLNKSGAYKLINDEIKEQVKSSLLESNNKEIQKLNINELVDYVVTEDILESEMDYVLDELYNNGNLKINRKILYDGYVKNINKYIEENKIQLPDEIQKQLNNSIVDNSITDEDITPKNNQYLESFNNAKGMVKDLKLILTISIVSLLVLTVILSKEKLRGIYIPFIFSGILLIIINCALKIALNSLNLTLERARLTEVIDSVKKIFFTQMNLYCGIFLAIGLVGVVAREIINIKKKFIDDKKVESVEKV